MRRSWLRQTSLLEKFRSLCRIRSRKAAEILTSFLQGRSKNSYVRTHALFALGETGLDDAVDVLKSVIYGSDDFHYYLLAATRALAHILSDNSIETLIVLLRQEDHDYRWIAAESLGWIGSRLAIRDVRRDKIVDALIAAVNADISKPGYGGHEALWALARIRSDKAVDALLEYLKIRGNKHRSSAAEALGWVRSERAVEDLINALQDDNEFVRADAASALGVIGSEKAMDALTAALSDDVGSVRWSAAKALGSIDSETSVRVLRALLSKREDETARLHALYGLNEAASDKLCDLFVLALRDESSAVRGEAAKALGRLRCPEGEGPLISILENKDGRARVHAASALGEMGSEQAVDALIAALQTDGWEEEYLRATAAQALGKIGSSKAFETLKVAILQSNVREGSRPH